MYKMKTFQRETWIGGFPQKTSLILDNGKYIEKREDMEEYFLCRPNLPKGRVTTVLISGEAVHLVSVLQALRIQPILTVASDRLPKPVRFHADMLCCYVGNGKAIVAAEEEQLENRLKCFGVQTIQTEYPLENQYPRDTKCNVLQIGEHVFYNPKSADRRILQQLETRTLHRVSQGYSRCSVAVADEHSAITADPGLAKAMKQAGLEVLEIQPGQIRLPGYDYGFIGGCCGLIAPDRIAFTGSLELHPDGERIKMFLYQRGISYVELTNETLLDIGGLIPLKEERKCMGKA